MTDSATLDDAIAGQDFVFAALSGDLPTYAQAIVDAMKRQGVKRLAFISSMGIYGELPARLGGDGTVAPVLRPYRQAADSVEESGLDYTVIRPGWFTGGPVNYELTVKGKPFGGHDASVASIADLVKRLVVEPGFGVKESLGLTPREVNWEHVIRKYDPTSSTNRMTKLGRTGGAVRTVLRPYLGTRFVVGEHVICEIV